jgi:hypothetical protein
MKQSFSDANISSASREMLRILWKKKRSFITVSTTALTCPYPDPSHLFNTHFNIILPSTPKSSKWPLSVSRPYKISIGTPLPLRRNIWIVSLITLDRIRQIIFGRNNKSWCSSTFSLIQSPANPFLLGPVTFLSTIFSKTLCLLSSHNVRDQVPHPYKNNKNYISVKCNLYIFGGIANCRIE